MAAKKKQVKAKPFPEAIDGQPWQIRESPTPRQAGVGEGKMMVPMGTDIKERAVRLHEMMHVSITDGDKMIAASQELPADILNNCEDARVHGHMQRIGFGEELGAMSGVISDFEMQQIAKEGQLIQLASIGAAMSGTPEWYRLKQAIEDNAGKSSDKWWAAHTGRILGKQIMHNPRKLPAWEDTVTLCERLIELFGDPGRPEEPAVVDSLSAAKTFEVAKTTAEFDKKPVTLKGGTKEHSEVYGWHKMEIVEPPLTVRLPAQMRMKPRKIPEAYGRRLRRVGRLYHDGRVFSRKLRKPGGGAVLIDASGSMSLEASDIMNLVQAYPGGVIATYCSESDRTGGRGWLTVIARNGMRCEDYLMEPPGGGNGVDGPALEWIAQHPGPRFWISDARVHGGAIGLAHCLGVCLKHNIKRVDNANEILGRV